MGFFSWECPVCNKSIRSIWATKDITMIECVVLMRDGTFISGYYDGYGRIEDRFSVVHDLMEIQPPRFDDEDFDLVKEFKMYHKRCWHKVGSPDFKHAKWSRYAEDQGFFYNEKEGV